MTKLSRVYIHVGADKTGSTTIQKFLDTNRQVLRKHGYCYPSLMPSELDDIASACSHHYVAACFSSNLVELDYYIPRRSLVSESLEKERAANYLGRISREILDSGCHSLILSYEGFHALKKDELQSLKAYLLGIADEVRLVYYLRPRLSYSISAISQRISMGMPMWKFHPPVNLYKHRLSALESIFGKSKMHVKRFAKSDFTQGDLITDFCKLIGLSQGFMRKAKPVKPVNESLSELAIRIGDAMVFLLKSADGPNGIEFYRLFFNDLKQLAGKRYAFNKLQRRIILEATREDTRFVLGNYGIDLDDSAEGCNESHPVITDEFAETVARYLIRARLPELKLSEEKYAPLTGECVKLPRGSINLVDYQMSGAHGYQVLELRIRVENHSNSYWGGDLLPVNLSYRWVDTLSEVREDTEYPRVSLLKGGIAAGESQDVIMPVILSKEDGEYILRLDLVQEFCAWFHEIGFNPRYFAVKIIEGMPVSIVAHHADETDIHFSDDKNNT